MHPLVVAMANTPATARYIKGSLNRGFRGSAKIGRPQGMQHLGSKAALFDWLTFFQQVEISFCSLNVIEDPSSLLVFMSSRIPISARMNEMCNHA
jgi:hypothetical protein